MKRILACCVALGVLCFGQLEVVEKKEKLKQGLFFGAGLGVGANAIKTFEQSTPINQTESNASFAISGKVGGYTYFTQMIGLRYYYNLDFNINPSGTNPNEFYILSSSHTINADVIFNAFSRNNIDLSLVGGIGMGFILGEYGARYKTVYAKSNDFADFEFRFNLGAKVMFNQKYGLELIAKLPVTPATQVVGNQTRYRKVSAYYFTLGFVMERF